MANIEPYSKLERAFLKKMAATAGLTLLSLSAIAGASAVVAMFLHR